ncbi:MAG: hypothetical protein MUD01_24685, partial [Chloroflexaceae bacterium]|nr:hypothetical protein [Chloroflexaceae bacterium]
REESNHQLYSFYLSRRFEAAHITAVAYVRRQLGQSRAQMEYCQECFFVQGLHKRFRQEHEHLPLALNTVPPVVLSEVLYNWDELTSNPKYCYED